MLYRKYRPQTFAQVIGQEHVVNTLKGGLTSGRVGHAYLFTGPRGTGKTTLARLLAKALNCEKRSRDGSPDNSCSSCLAVNENRSLDLIEIDAASNRGIDEIRNLRESARVAAPGGGKKVFVIDEVHALTKDAFNALLKILEEPPSHVVFILATTEPHKILIFTLPLPWEELILERATSASRIAPSEDTAMAIKPLSSISIFSSLAISFNFLKI